MTHISKKINNAVTVADYKNAMARFATGVSLVTTCNQEGNPAGLLISSLSSVSLDPPLILFCLAKKSQLHSVFAKTEFFVVNIFCQKQRETMNLFIKPDEYIWNKISYDLNENQIPVLKENLATVECYVVNRFDGGDHTIYIGQAMNVEHGQGQPILYYNRGFGAFNSDQD